MKKIVTLLAACVAIILASCAQPSTAGSGVGLGGALKRVKQKLHMD